MKNKNILEIKEKVYKSLLEQLDVLERNSDIQDRSILFLQNIDNTFVENFGEVSIDQKIVFNIPVLGKFKAEPVKIALIACLIEFYYGEKDTIKRLIYNCFGVPIKENALVSKEKNDERLKNFLNECKFNGLIDDKLNIANNTINKIYSLQHLANSIGFLFEIFLGLSLNKKVSTNIDAESIKSKKSDKHLSFAVDALFILYILTDADIASNKVTKCFNTSFIHKLILVYRKTNFNSLNIIDDLVNKSINKSDLFFEFDAVNRPLDLVVRSIADERPYAFIDIKSHNKDSSYDTYTLSSSTEKCKEQIASEFSGNPITKDFNVCVLHLFYQFKEKNIDLFSYNAIFQKYSDLKVNYRKKEEKIDFKINIENTFRESQIKYRKPFFAIDIQKDLRSRRRPPLITPGQLDDLLAKGQASQEKLLEKIKTSRFIQYCTKVTSKPFTELKAQELYKNINIPYLQLKRNRLNRIVFGYSRLYNRQQKSTLGKCLIAIDKILASSVNAQS